MQREGPLRGYLFSAAPTRRRAKVIKMRPDLTPIWRVSPAALCSRELGESGEYGDPHHK
jgi:hypothetical protein